MKLMDFWDEAEWLKTQSVGSIAAALKNAFDTGKTYSDEHWMYIDKDEQEQERLDIYLRGVEEEKNK